MFGFTALSGTTPIKASWKSVAAKAAAVQQTLSLRTDDQLRKDSLALRYEILSGTPANQLMVRAFALVRESARRTVDMQHYPVQLIGGAAMVDGSIAVMQTGEGKTLTATLPLYLAALSGKGAHLATANDYLAARDAELMSPVFRALGMSVGVVEQKTARRDRKTAYGCDITYSTAKEIGFDFLRDRLQKRSMDESGIQTAVFEDDLSSLGPDSITGAGGAEIVQRELFFMLVDEADSILIDEARTPLVISSLPNDLYERQALYQWAADAVKEFRDGEHFDFDRETQAVELTAKGRTTARKIAKPSTLDRTPLADIYDQLQLALIVEQKFILDRHYVVRDGQVVIVDEFSGRMAEGRKWRAGLHQAIEAREGLEITSETSEAARITVQDLFLKYLHLCGMTGTVASSSRELFGIYGTPVATIPTNRPPKRKGLADLVFGHQMAKWNAIVDEVNRIRQSGRPVLIGTRSIDKSELLSGLLTEQGIDHQVLNARHLKREAEIVSGAGQLNQVTVATNMAGRGTDIRLSPDARAAGGLHVIISELHESERIDRQLIGRSGRQGDPGSYRFFMAMDDDILATGFGASVADRLSHDGKLPEELPQARARLFRSAQKKIEARHYKGRKLLLAQEKRRQKAQMELGQDPYVDTIS